MLVVGMMMTSCGDRVEAQALASPRSQGLRIDWAVEPARGQWQTVCGHIYNDTPVAPREIRLLVEGRDTSDRIIDSRITYVLGYIAPWGRTYSARPRRRAPLDTRSPFSGLSGLVIARWPRSVSAPSPRLRGGL